MSAALAIVAVAQTKISNCWVEGDVQGVCLD